MKKRRVLLIWAGCLVIAALAIAVFWTGGGEPGSLQPQLTFYNCGDANRDVELGIVPPAGKAWQSDIIRDGGLSDGLPQWLRSEPLSSVVLQIRLLDEVPPGKPELDPERLTEQMAGSHAEHWRKQVPAPDPATKEGDKRDGIHSVASYWTKGGMKLDGRRIPAVTVSVVAIQVTEGRPRCLRVSETFAVVKRGTRYLQAILRIEKEVPYREETVEVDGVKKKVPVLSVSDSTEVQADRTLKHFPIKLGSDLDALRESFELRTPVN